LISRFRMPVEAP